MLQRIERPPTVHIPSHRRGGRAAFLINGRCRGIERMLAHRLKERKKPLSMNVFIYTLTNFTVGSVEGPIKLKSLS